MEIKIKETGEVEELNIIDPKSGLNWIGGMLDNADAIDWQKIEGEEVATMSQEDYEWWVDYVSSYQEADNKLNEYKRDDQQKILEAVGSPEFNDWPAAVMFAIDKIENKTYEIEIAIDSVEPDKFCAWLNENGHSATIGNSTGNYIDGILTDHDIDANDIMNNLWADYCNS